jgi:hypothetical protein
MNYYKELVKLQTKYKDLLDDRKTPIEMTTKEQNELTGYDRALQRVLDDITKIIDKGHDNEKLAYTE